MDHKYNSTMLVAVLYLNITTRFQLYNKSHLWNVTNVVMDVSILLNNWPVSLCFKKEIQFRHCNGRTKPIQVKHMGLLCNLSHWYCNINECNFIDDFCCSVFVMQNAWNSRPISCFTQNNVFLWDRQDQYFQSG